MCACQAGAPYFMTREDLKVVAPLWSAYARKVRNDPTAWNLTGDIHTHQPGDKPWIAGVPLHAALPHTPLDVLLAPD
jgi:hypothetical protein